MKRSEYLMHQLDMVTAGERVDDVLTAAMNHMAALIGFACDTPEQADKFCDDTAADLKRVVRDNWENSREQRARSGLQGRG